MFTKLINHLTSKTPPEILSKRVNTMPRSYFDWRKQTSFQNLIRYVSKNSPFYKRKFKEFGIDPDRVRSPKDLGDFYTMPIDIIENAEEFLCQKPHIVFESSGTTGRNKRVYFTQHELDQIGKYNAIGFYGLGLTKEDRVVNAFDFCIWIPGMITQKGLEKSGIFGMAAGKIDPLEVYRRIPIYGFNVIFGEPTWLIKLTEIAEKHGSYPLKMLIGGAEAMPDAARPWMERVWQGAKVRMAYGTVESGGTLAFELDPICKHYHINENSFWMEILNPDPEGYGEVVFTTLDRRTMPLIHYRTRDISRMVEEKCPCGLPYRRLEKIRGRADEMVIASGGNLYPLMFEGILNDIPGISKDWQVIMKLNGIKEVMEFNLELSLSSGDQSTIQEKIFSNIRDFYPDLWKNYSLGIFHADFMYHSPGSLRVNRKMIRLVDQRNYSQGTGASFSR